MMQLLQVGVPVGEFVAQIGLARRVRDESGDPEVRAGAQHFIATALTQTMDLEAARLALEDSVARSAAVDIGAAWASLTSLAVLVYQTAGDPRSSPSGCGGSVAVTPRTSSSPPRACGAEPPPNPPGGPRTCSTRSAARARSTRARRPSSSACAR